jgi:hypothetical protein
VGPCFSPLVITTSSFKSSFIRSLLSRSTHIFLMEGNPFQKISIKHQGFLHLAQYSIIPSFYYSTRVPTLRE